MCPALSGPAASARPGSPGTLAPRQLGAIKLLRNDAEHEDLVRFEREVSILGEVEHPALVRLLDVGEHHGSPFLVTEYAPGDHLEFRLRAGQPLAVERCLEVFADLAFGLAHAHALGIHHRDIKAENVVVGPDGWGRLVDFGFAIKGGTSRVTSLGQVIGTVSYLPPEAVSGQPRDEAKADIYALGQVLHEALTGRPAFRGDGLGRRRQSRVNAVPPGEAGSDGPRSWRHALQRAASLGASGHGSGSGLSARIGAAARRGVVSDAAPAHTSAAGASGGRVHRGAGPRPLGPCDHGTARATLPSSSSVPDWRRIGDRRHFDGLRVDRNILGDRRTVVVPDLIVTPPMSETGT